MAKVQQTLTDAFIFRCRNCNVKLSARPTSIGKSFACPKCNANVTVRAPQTDSSPKVTQPKRDPIEQLAAFVYAVSLFATSPLFNGNEDKEDDLYNRHDDLRFDPDAYPGEVLTLLSEFSLSLKQELQKSYHANSPMPFVSWDDLTACKRFSHLYWAMANMDERFSAPFEMPDETWVEGQRTDEELRKILLMQIDNFEAAASAFSNHYRDSEVFRQENVMEVLMNTNLGMIPRVRREERYYEPQEPTDNPEPPGTQAESAPEPRICCRCQSALSSHHRFCGDCGQAVGPQCSACHADLISDDRFCRNCGQPVVA